MRPFLLISLSFRVEDLKCFDICVTNCDIDRLKHLELYLEGHLNGVTSISETVSLISEHSFKKQKGNRFATFLRNAATLTKKSASLDYSSESPIENSTGSRNTRNKDVMDEVSQNMSHSISEESWFHGVLPREDVIRLLKW